MSSTLTDLTADPVAIVECNWIGRSVAQPEKQILVYDAKSRRSQPAYWVRAEVRYRYDRNVGNWELMTDKATLAVQVRKYEWGMAGFVSVPLGFDELTTRQVLAHIQMSAGDRNFFEPDVLELLSEVRPKFWSNAQRHEQVPVHPLLAVDEVYGRLGVTATETAWLNGRLCWDNLYLWHPAMGDTFPTFVWKNPPELAQSNWPAMQARNQLKTLAARGV